MHIPFPGKSHFGRLQADDTSQEMFGEQVESIRATGLTGKLTATVHVMTYTAPDGRAFDISQQDGDLAEDGTLEWAIHNKRHTSPGDPAQGISYSVPKDDVGECLRTAVFDSACPEAFTLKSGSPIHDFQAFTVTATDDGQVASIARFNDVTTKEVLDVHFDHDSSVLTVYLDEEELTDADGVIEHIVDYSTLEVPDGTPSEKFAWHMGRSLGIAAARDASPAWTHPYRIDGLTWENRNDI